MKKFLIAAFAVFVAFAVTGCGDTVDSNTKEGFAEAYGVEEDHVFEHITIDELNAKLSNNEKFLVYYGNKDCINCVTNVKVFQQYADYYNEENETKVDKIYYLNTLDYDTDVLKTLPSTTGVSDYKNTPQLWLFNNGAIVKDSYKDYTALSLDFYQATREIFELYIA